MRVASMEGYIPPGLLLLDMGVLRRFSGLELQSDYFRNNVIEEQGLGGPSLGGAGLRTNLPEGFYTFRVQALEAGTGREVSNMGETFFSITSPLPPVINLPFNGAVLRQAQDDGSVTLSLSKSPQIQWMPRHYKQAGNTTTYDLKVCKVPDGYEPQEALDACVNPIIDDKANPGTFYPSNTGIGNSIIGAFERGAKYAVRVTVHEFDANGDEVVFANEGRSEVVWFTYGTPCVSAENFIIRETGPGRLQLSWPAAAGSKSYRVMYRREGESQWTTQAVTATGIGLADLKPGKHEIGVQSECTDVFPRTDVPANIQAFELSDDEQDDLIPALADPLNTIVTVSDTGIPYVIDSLHSVLDVIKIPCASQISTYESCEADLPVVSPVGVATPGTKPLPSLSAGDVLSVYDMTMIVTSAGNGAGGFRGTGLARLPFMESTMVSVEFDGVQAWAPQEAGVPGGCVYQINGYFRTKALSAEELARQQAGLVATLNNPKDSTAFTGTLSDALKKYDDGVTTTDLSRYTAAVLQGSQTIANALDEVVDEYSDPRLIHISTQLDSLMQVLKTNDSLMKATGEVIRIDNLTGIYTDLFKKLEELKNEGKPDVNNPVYAISNVQVSNVDDKSARISWQAEGPVSRYVIEYRDTDGGVLQETVTGTKLNLLRLRADMEYRYRILAYNGDELVASYGEDVFKTTGKFVPVPVNLAYTRIDDNAVSITWDPDAQHNRFKIRYEDKNGEIRYVYPTTNTAVLDGLDPTRFHDYEIVAYNKESVQSEPANARVTAGLNCDLQVRMSNSSTVATIPDGETWLSSYGCNGGEATWENGSKMISNDGQTITWADGEIAQVTYGFVAEYIVVRPKIDKEYTAVCVMREGAQSKTCTNTVTVKVSSPECTGSFKISTDSQILNKGDLVTIKAEGCNDGKIIWSNGWGEGTDIKFRPSSDVIASAKCIIGKITCYSNSLAVSVNNCQTSLYVFRSQGDKKSKNRSALIYYTGCSTFPVNWHHDGNANGAVYGKLGYSISKIEGPVTVFATCRSSSDCKEISLVIPVPDRKCNGHQLRMDKNLLEIDDKPTTISSDHAFKLQDQKGDYVNTAFQTSVTLPVNTHTQLYTATYENGCTSSIEVMGYFPSYSIEWAGGYSSLVKFTGDVKDITKLNLEKNPNQDNYKLTMSLSNLCSGDGKNIIWTNNQDPSFRIEGAPSLRFDQGMNYDNSATDYILSFPKVTTIYYATCYQKNANGGEDIYPATNSKTITVNSNYCFRIDQNLGKVSKGEHIILRASGCNGGTDWYLGETLLGSGRNLLLRHRLLLYRLP
ncbi:fibronectin type III domain-containing protein [Dyadobacter sp. 32]|uniref:fibronectin type III domain-containing protein n=1 Tax=Dyadobacter sp. 32 TaxID=538966 RepID=UPI0039C6EB8D